MVVAIFQPSPEIAVHFVPVNQRVSEVSQALTCYSNQQMASLFIQHVMNVKSQNRTFESAVAAKFEFEVLTTLNRSLLYG
jgi:hypothetical protein